MPKVERFQSKKDNQFYWHLKDDNGEPICHGEGHPDKESVPRAVNNVARAFVALAQDAEGDIEITDVEAT